MTSTQKTVLAGVLFGTVAGAIIALAVMGLVPEFGHPLTVRNLSAEFGWAFFFSWPVGPLAGACGGAFLHWRARSVASFRNLVVEAIGLAAGAVAAATQVVIPIAWELPRLQVTTITVLGAAVCAAIGAMTLKRLYWRSVDNR